MREVAKFREACAFQRSLRAVMRGDTTRIPKIGKGRVRFKSRPGLSMSQIVAACLVHGGRGTCLWQRNLALCDLAFEQDAHQVE